MFFPPAVTMMSFFRSVIARNPSRISPMSPVWNQPSGSIASRGGVGLVVVALHYVRPAGQDLSVGSDLHFHSVNRLADGADAEVLRGVDGDDGRRLGQPVALEDLQSGGVKELVDLRRERSAAGDEIPEPSACSRP